MKICPRTLPTGLLLVALLGATTGCQKDGANGGNKETKMRSAYDNKPYNINDVPPEQRTMVEGFMKAGKDGKMPGPASSPAAKPSPTK